MNSQSGVEKFFSVALRTQTYSNLLYLLLSFPLGIFYFVFLITGISLGIGLAIVWVGLLILGLVIAAWVALGAFERQMAIGMLGEKIPPYLRADLTNRTLWQKFTALLGSAATWKSLAYLLLKFPLGIVNFVTLVTSLAVSLALATTPLYYRWFAPQFNFGGPWDRVYYIDTPVAAAIACLVGLALLFLSLHLLNGLAWVSGRFARIMLGDANPAAVSPPGMTPAESIAAASAAGQSSTPPLASFAPAAEPDDPSI